ncbi:MAG: winged helix-turn-helix transcriptional regulator, partial [Bacteroidales bacterium]|nr:winged helix-turn-helix transcriptional regulator [Bacteroidales bacterium]
SHPARLAIIKYLAEQKSCISGNISDFIPLSRTTVSQHLQELKKAGLIKGTIDGLKVNYCICNSNMNKVKKMFNNFFKETVLSNKDNIC